ncbi:MAG: nucleoside hydrolase [Alphaproteobacteria bacterium]|nr:nucleoside hydrolase [Alphaproteobacteria bacterium]
MSAKTKIIIDTDPGIDDAIALFMAMADPNLEIVGMTAVNGNVSVDKAEYNIRRICDFAWHTNIPVYKGCDRPLKRSVLNAEWVHGADGLAGLDFGTPAYQGEKEENAVDFIIKTLMKSPEKEVSIIAIGPLTNIATVFLKEPRTISRIRELIIMGGAFCEDGPRGNSTPYAEFNMLADPHAAQIVFDTAERVTVVPMEVGMQAEADKEFLEKMRDLNTRCAEISADMLDITAKTLSDHLAQKSKTGTAPEKGTSLYDPCAVGCLIRPALFSGKYGTVQVNTNASDEKFGMTTFEEGNKRNCLVTHKVDKESFKEMLLAHLANLP